LENKVYFVGAGPGDPELITIKGRALLDAAQVVIYAGSLVNPALLGGIRAKIYDSSGMTLDGIIDVMRQSVSAGKTPVVRLHTGDTAFYSAVTEQINRLCALGIGYEIVPGVSSVSAGAAALGQELTIPDVSQTVIITRIAGRTGVPEDEKLSALAAHHATMAIFLSAGMVLKVKEELLAAYAGDTPVAVVERASWPGQRVLRGVLGDLDVIVNEAGITKTAIIYVGAALAASSDGSLKESRLYDASFKHEYRK
jgi:precorrin-4/cobalt-precorrin-4 C11-methyltransferase